MLFRSEFLSDPDKTVSVARVRDEYGHRDDVRKLPAGLRQRRLEVSERLARLTLEVAFQVSIGPVQAAVAREPDDAPANRRNRWRERAALLPVSRIEFFLHTPFP